MQPLIDSLYAYNDWANRRVLEQCESLTDEQLDEPRPIGFGTLRATLFHILTADQIWLERWESIPWRPFPKDPASISVAEIAKSLVDVSTLRARMIEQDRGNRWKRIVEYQDSTQTPYKHRLHDLLLHVFQHGVHHRAQCLNYLKQFGRTFPIGIDFIFWRLAQGATKQSAEAINRLAEHGLAANEAMGDSIEWDRATMRRLYQYTDWATEKVLSHAEQLGTGDLDRSFDMGHGSIRKNLLHMYKSERWWLETWTGIQTTSSRLPESTTIGKLRSLWQTNADARNRYLDEADEEESHRVVEVTAVGPPLRFTVGESAMQMTMHGTHHRAQIVNLFRQVDSPIGNIDMLYAIDELGEFDAP